MVALGKGLQQPSSIQSKSGSQAHAYEAVHASCRKVCMPLASVQQRFLLYSINIDQAPFQATLRGCWQDMLTDAAVRPLLDCLQHQASCLGKAFIHVCTAQDANPSECIWMAALI